MRFAPRFQNFTALFIVGSLLLTSGCLPVSQPDQSNNSCSENYAKVIVPVEIRNKTKLFFAISDFGFLGDSTIQIDNVSLEGTVIPHRSSVEDFSFDMNGIKTSRKDGGAQLELDCSSVKKSADLDRSKDRTAPRVFCAPVHKFYLNGGEPFDKMMVKIKKNAGVLRLTLHSRDSEITSAKLVVNGTKYTSCKEPPPPPPPTPVAPNVIVDSFNPVVSPTGLTTKTISFSADQTGVTFYCALDLAAEEVCSSPIAYSNLNSAAHVFTVYAKNAAGLPSAPVQHSWVVDAQAPSVTIDNLASLPALTTTGTISLAFSSNEAASFSCSIDGAAAEPCTSPKLYTALGDGSHQVLISAADAVGNVNVNGASFQWVVDQTAPVAVIVSAVPSAAVNNSSLVLLQFAANESATLECSIDNGAFSACTSPLNVSGVTEGSHWFAVRATDVAGNVGVPASYNWRTDLSAPVIIISNTIPAAGLSGAHNISVEFSVSEEANVQCNLNGVAASCASPFTAFIADGGVHTLTISATDLAGNVAISQSVVWSMDYTNPTISFGLFTPSSASFIKTGLVVEIIYSELVDISAALNGSDMGVVSSPIDLSGLVEGSYSLAVTAVDKAGNPANVITHNFTLDSSAPVLSLSAAIQGLTKLDSNTLTFSANENGSFECNLDQAGYAPCLSPLGLSGLAGGSHEAIVRAVDLAGNVSIEGSVQWTVDNVAPLTFLVASFTGRDSIAVELSSSEGNSTFACALDGIAVACGPSLTLGNLSVGSHSLTAWATDQVGNTDNIGATYTFGVVGPITTSIVSASPSSAYTNVRSRTFTFVADREGASFICSLNGAPATACISPMTYSELPDGSYTFKVQAVDSFGSMDLTGASSTWTVDNVAPVVLSFNATTTSTSITLTWTTSEPATAGLVWGLTRESSNLVPQNSTYATTHTVRLTGLSSNTLYYVKAVGKDPAGNDYVSNQMSVRTGR